MIKSAPLCVLIKGRLETESDDLGYCAVKQQSRGKQGMWHREKGREMTLGWCPEVLFVGCAGQGSGLEKGL